MPTTPRVAAARAAASAQLSRRSSATVSMRPVTRKASSSRSRPVGWPRWPNCSSAAELSQTECRSPLTTTMGAGDAASKSARLGASGQSASRNPTAMKGFAPPGRTASAMRRAVSAAEPASATSRRDACRAHWLKCTWLSHRPGPSHRPARSTLSSLSRDATCPASAMSTITPRPTRTSTTREPSRALRSSIAGRVLNSHALSLPISWVIAVSRLCTTSDQTAAAVRTSIFPVFAPFRRP